MGQTVELSLSPPQSAQYKYNHALLPEERQGEKILKRQRSLFASKNSKKRDL